MRATRRGLWRWRQQPSRRGAGALLASLLRGGLWGGGWGGGGGGGINELTQINALTQLGDIKAEIATTAAATQANTTSNTLQQTIAIQQAFNNLGMAGAEGFSSTKQAIAETGFALQTSIKDLGEQMAEGFCGVKTAIAASTQTIVSKLDQSTIDELRTRLLSVESDQRSNGVKVQVDQIQNNNQQQAQFQVQSALNDIRSFLGVIGNQVNRQSEVIFNSGTLTGSGNQSAANTRVA